MTARRVPAVCANPLCADQIRRDLIGAIEMTQLRDAGDEPGRWTLCGIACARTFLTLSNAHNRALDIQYALDDGR